MRQDRSSCSKLMDKASSGDDAAFGTLAMAVQDDLFRFGLAHSLRHADAAEAVQEVFLRAYAARKSWQVGGDAVSYLYGIAMNVVREFVRRNRRRGGEGLELDSLAGGDCDRPGAIGRGHEALSGDGDDARQRDQLARAMAGLPPRQQEAVACRYLLQMDLRQTADIMGCAEGTVKAAVFAGLANLRKLLKKELIEP